MRRHVARRARVGVVAPRAADILTPFQHDEIVVSRLVELDCGTHTGEPTPDDGDVNVVGQASRSG